MPAVADPLVVYVFDRKNLKFFQNQVIFKSWTIYMTRPLNVDVDEQNF